MTRVTETVDIVAHRLLVFIELQARAAAALLAEGSSPEVVINARAHQAEGAARERINKSVVQLSEIRRYALSKDSTFYK